MNYALFSSRSCPPLEPQQVQRGTAQAPHLPVGPWDPAIAEGWEMASLFICRSGYTIR